MFATIRDILIIAHLMAWALHGPNMTELKGIVDYQYQQTQEQTK